MKQTKTEHKEELHLQNSANNSTESNQQSSELIHREELPNSVMQIIQIEQGWFLALGKNRITDYYQTKEELLQHKTTDNFLMTLIATVAEKVYEIQKNQNNEKNKTQPSTNTNMP